MSSLTSRVLVACSEYPGQEAPAASAVSGGQTAASATASSRPEIANQADRCWLLAEGLAARHDVILAVPAVTGLYHRQFAVVYYNARNIWLVARDSDVAVCDAAVLADHPHLLNAGKPVAVDLAGVPFPSDSNSGTDRLAAVLGAGDFFFCSSEEERQAWLPRLERSGRVNQYTLEGDGSLRRLIEVAGPDRIGPLLDYCAVPRFAPDRGTGLSLADLPQEGKRAKGIAHYWRALIHMLRYEGIRAVWTRGCLAIKRKISSR